MSRIDELNSEISALTAQLRTLTAERDALLIAAQNPFPIGSVIGWGRKTPRRGRVTEHRLKYGELEYHVVSIRRDGSEGETVKLDKHDAPHLIAEEYAEGENYAPAPSTEQRTPTELAAGISAHLKRMEAAEESKQGKEDRRTYYYAGAARSGRFISVRYISYQHTHKLTREEAGRYLDWLNAGNEGRHYEALKEATA